MSDWISLERQIGELQGVIQPRNVKFTFRVKCCALG